MFRSNVNGLSWRLSPTPAEDLIWADGAEGHAGYLFLTASGAVYRSRPDSAAWTRVPSPGTPAIWHWQSNGAVLRAFGRNGAFHSADTGAIWTKLKQTYDILPRVELHASAPNLLAHSPDESLFIASDFGLKPSAWHPANTASTIKKKSVGVTSARRRTGSGRSGLSDPPPWPFSGHIPGSCSPPSG